MFPKLQEFSWGCLAECAYKTEMFLVLVLQQFFGLLNCVGLPLGSWHDSETHDEWVPRPQWWALLLLTKVVYLREKGHTLLKF